MRQTGRKREDLVLLDAGCGTGNYIFELSKVVGRAFGFDFNEGMLDQARLPLLSPTPDLCGGGDGTAENKTNVNLSRNSSFH